MRVATRRMRAAVDLFGAFYNPKALKPFFQGLRLTGRMLGKVRDLDVTIEKFSHYLQQLPAENQVGLTPLLEHWDLLFRTSPARNAPSPEQPGLSGFQDQFHALFTNSWDGYCQIKTICPWAIHSTIFSAHPDLCSFGKCDGI